MDIPGYRLLEQIHESYATRVYRALREVDRAAVVVKLLREDYPSERTLARFQLGYDIGRAIESTRVIEHLALERAGNSLALITEDYGASSLDRMRSSELDLVARLEIAVALAAALADVHAHQVIHKDIKPHNVVIGQSDRGLTLKLIDFGISSRLTRENPTLTSPEKLEGTLAYISPEQTGRMNRSVDSRSDLYSFGITLYELFTGRLPFRHDDPMELIHCHIARAPTPPRELEERLPRVVSEAVLKLMAKTAEERYQSAFGIRRDLERALQQLKEIGKVKTFEIGTEDVADRFYVPEKVYGRDAELEVLLEAFQRAGYGGRELLMVAGYSGIGKSALIQEVHKPIVARHGYFCAGKFDQFRRYLPYQALIDALRDLLRQTLAESEERIGRIRDLLVEALGPNGRVLTDVIPELEQYVGPQPEVQQLSPSEARARFDRVFTQFIRVFARAEHPLTLFIDDLQWADTPSLQLIELLITTPAIGHLLLVGAYRDNEVDETHPLSAMLKRLDDVGVRPARIDLPPLELDSVIALVADATAREADSARSLAEIVHAKTGGNPFFVGEFLRALYRERMLDFDPQAGRWTWDVVAIAALETTENVVELVGAKLATLPEETLEIVRDAACVGGRFDLRTLALASGQTRGEAARRLQPALAEGLVLPVDDDYKYMAALEQVGNLQSADQVNNAWYRFLHDRVHQAAYDGLDEAAREQRHLTIGRVLEQHCTPEERDDRLIDIANHFDLARRLIGDPSERRKLAELHLEAGRRAKASMAFIPSAHYLRSALDLLASDAWKTDYQMALAIHLETADAVVLCERWDELDELVEAVLSNARDYLDKVPVHRTRIQARIAQRDPWGALDIAIDVLANLGIQIPRKPRKWHVLAELLRTRRVIGRRAPGELARLPAMTDERLLAAMDVMRNNASSAYFTDADLFVILVLKQVQLAAAHGNSAFAANAYELYGMMLCGAFWDCDNGYGFGRLGFEVIERHPSANLAGKMAMIWGTFVAPWKDSARSCAELLLEGWRPAVDGGDLEYAAYSVLQSLNISVLAGSQLGDLLERYRDYGEWIHSTTQLMSIDLFDAWLQAVHNLADPDRVVSALYGEHFDLDGRLQRYVETDDRMPIAYASVAEGMLAYLLGEPDRARASLERAIEHEDRLFASLMIPGTYFYLALVLLRPAHGAPDRKARARVRAILKQMRRWARYNPASFAHKVELIEAERARAHGDPLSAGPLYRRAIEGARASGFVNDEAVACELYARCWLDRDEPEAARMFMARARQAYRMWGAAAKVRQLETTYDSLLADVDDGEHRHGSLVATASAAGTSTSQHDSASLDLATVLKASQALAGQSSLAPLLIELIAIVLENAGADRGLILLQRDEQLRIEAEGVVGGETRVLQSQTLDLSPGTEPTLPISIVQYVARAHEVTVLDDAPANARFGGDPYVALQRPRSILCSPLLHQGELTGLLYLENRLTTDAFTPRRVELLGLLAGLFATSIHKAEVYDNLEALVAERTEQLEDRNRFIRNVFGRYLSDEIVDSLIDDADGLELGGEKRTVTIMMTDLRGFSAMSERLRPEQVVTLINTYLSVMTEILVRHRGTIDEFIGDAILAIFGAPLLRADDADRAIQCAVEMMNAMGEVNRRNVEAGLPELEMGIGLHTGVVVVGNIGSEKRAKYGVVGPTVNLCGRIESCTVGGQILISEATADAATIELTTGAELTIVPKGVDRAIAIYEVLGAGDVALDRTLPSLTPVEGLSLSYTPLEGKQVTDETHEARVLRISAAEVEIECDGGPAPAVLDDLRLRLDGSELYAKTLSSAGRVCLLRFTSVPPEAAAALAAHTHQ